VLGAASEDRREPLLDDRLLDAVLEFRGVPRKITELSGGLTNRNYKVMTPSGSFVLRISPQGSELLAINRDNEYRNSVCAANAGVGAPVVAYLPTDSAMVVGFIDGVTFTDESFSIAGNIARIADSCKRLHSGERFVNDFNMFKIQRNYLALVQERGFRLPEGYLDFLPATDQIRKALSIRDEGTVPCNNDLLAGNFVDDGQKIWLIDYEYSGNNDACFELGNIWSECHLSLAQLDEFIAAYYGAPLRNKIARAQLLGLMSQYGWTLWASIQESTSALDFDFWEWGMEKYERAVQTFRSPAFLKMLEEVQRHD
jgi:thiamine kinase-like enzyme